MEEDCESNNDSVLMDKVLIQNIFLLPLLVVCVLLFIHFISFHFICCSFISFHFISFHFISFHFISFHLHFIYSAIVVNLKLVSCLGYVLSASNFMWLLLMPPLHLKVSYYYVYFLNYMFRTIFSAHERSTSLQIIH